MTAETGGPALGRTKRRDVFRNHLMHRGRTLLARLKQRVGNVVPQDLDALLSEDRQRRRALLGEYVDQEDDPHDHGVDLASDVFVADV